MVFFKHIIVSILTIELCYSGLNFYKLAQFVESWLKTHRSASKHEDQIVIEKAINFVDPHLSENNELEEIGKLKSM